MSSQHATARHITGRLREMNALLSCTFALSLGIQIIHPIKGCRNEGVEIVDTEVTLKRNPKTD